MSRSKLYFNTTSLNTVRYKKKLLRVFNQILDNGVLLNGPANRLLQKQLTDYFKESVTLCASGHDALSLALNSLHLSKTDEIIFPINAYPTAFPIFLSGAKPVGVDVDENAQLSVSELEKNITPRTKVIILVHMYGLVGNLKQIQDLAKRKKIILIEDCAQSFGTQFNSQLTGTFGRISCFSFYPTKNLAALGDGGAILAKDKKIHTMLNRAVMYGEKKRYQSEFISAHSRIPEIQASALSFYLKQFPSEMKKKKNLYRYYQKELRKADLAKFVQPLSSHKRSDPVVHLFVVRVKNRDKLQRYLAQKKIPTAVHYPYPVHKVKAFASFFSKKSAFPVSEKLAKEILSLPFHSQMTKAEITYIIRSISAFYA